MHFFQSPPPISLLLVNSHFYYISIISKDFKLNESVRQVSIIMTVSWSQYVSLMTPLQHDARITFTLPPVGQSEARVAVTAVTASHVVTWPVPAQAGPHDALVHVWGATKGKGQHPVFSHRSQNDHSGTRSQKNTPGVIKMTTFWQKLAQKNRAFLA